MAFRWAEYLDVARHLLAPNTGISDEAAKRCAISRAYYAAFCHARNWAVAQTGFRRSAEVDDHLALLVHFRERGRTDLASKLTGLRERRNACDYDDTIPPALDATALVAQALSVIEALPPLGPRHSPRQT